MTASLSEIISIMALILSTYATIQTIRFNARQKSLIESQERLNAILFEKESNEALSDKKADVSARVITIGSRHKLLKVWNQGKSTARNVAISFPEGNEFVHQGDLEEKFPMEALERLANVELIIVDDMNTKSKQAVHLRWDDDFQAGQEKLVYITL